jgi:hypothetical protein
MATRRFDFAAGFESSEAPSGTAPVSGTDLINLSYANTTYALRADFGYDVASYAALKALGTSGDDARQDGQVRLISGTGELWYFDADSSATDDGATILQPNSGTGRWLIASAAGASSSGTGGPSLEVMIDKLTTEQNTKNRTLQFSDSVGVAPYGDDQYSSITGSLLETYSVSGQTQVPVVWGARALRDADLNIDATTSWTAVQDGTTLTATSTAGEFKVGTAALKFNKASSAVKAGLRFDRGSANFNISGNQRLFLWVKLPSLVNLSNVYVRMYDSGTTNFAEWTATTNLTGSALVADWNLMFFDLTRTPDATGGSGWTVSTLSRYFEMGVTASSSAQTYTGIIFDAVYFSYTNVNRLGLLGKEHSIFNSSNKQSVVFDIASASGDGLLDLASPMSFAWNGGLTSSNAFIQRSVLKQNDITLDFNTAFSSGTIALDQDYRASRTLREQINGTIEGFVDFEQAENFEVLGVSASSISGRDYGLTSGNCLSGDVFDVFQVYYDREQADYIWKESITLTGNSTGVSGSNLIVLPVGSSGTIVAGDYLSKRSVSSEFSLVNVNQNETFTSFNLMEDPDGRQAFEESAPVPFPSELDYHFKLGGLTDNYATRNRGLKTTSIDKLSVVGAATLDNVVRPGMFAYSTSNGTAIYLEKTGTATDLDLNSSNSIEALCWVKFTSPPISANLFGAFNGWDTNFNGWVVTTNTSGELRILIRASGANADVNDFTSIPVTLNKWALLYFYGYETGNVSRMWYNGVGQSDTLTGVVTFTPIFRVVGGGASVNNTIQMSELLIYTQRDTAGRLFSDSLLTEINNGGPKAWDSGFVNRNVHRQTGQSGQRLSMKVASTKRITGAKGPKIKRFGAIKI